MTSKEYIDRLINSHVTMFGTKPKQTAISPLEKRKPPELDVSKILGIYGVEIINL